MARKARVVIPESAHHVVARGVNGCRLYRHGYDKKRYLKRFAELAQECGVSIHAYCLMDNHVHFLLVPEKPTSLAKLFRKLHTWWANYFNTRTKRTGHLFASRFYSEPVDEEHYWAAMRYIELNPKRAGLGWKGLTMQYSSLWAHLKNAPDPLVALDTEAIKRRRWSGRHWREFLEEANWERDKRLRANISATRQSE
jgi:putative transposase